MRSRFNVLVLAVLLSAIVFSQGWDCFDDDPAGAEGSTGVSPPSPWLIYPAEGSTNQSRTPTFYWQCNHFKCAEMTLTYTLELEGPGEETVEYSPDGDDLFIELVDTLDAETYYSWTVIAENSGGYTEPSYTWRFQTGTGFNNPPLPPENIYPTGHNIPLDPTFSWTCLDPEGDPLTYDLWLGLWEDGEYELISEGQGETEYHLQDPLLEYYTDYKWRVVAHDAESESAPSFRYIFTTRPENLPPSIPVAVYPLDEARGIPLNLTLRWTESIDPEGEDVVYDVYFGETEILLSDDIIADDISETFVEVENLSYNNIYYWGVSAIDASGSRTNKDAISFTTIPDPGQYPGIYAELMIHRSQYISKGIPPDPDETIRIDFVSARFDSVYAPDGPDVPKQPAAVSYNVGGDVHMSWNDSKKSYYYDNPYNLWFLAPGYDYTFNVTEGDDVPALTKTIYYPECRPFLDSPDAYSNVSRNGFEVTWAGHDLFSDCPDEVRIRIKDMGPLTWTDVDKMVPNTGSYIFTSDDLSGLDPMTYQILVVLIIENMAYIDSPGYDTRSWAWARTHSTLFLNLD